MPSNRPCDGPKTAHRPRRGEARLPPLAWRTVSNFCSLRGSQVPMRETHRNT